MIREIISISAGEPPGPDYPPMSSLEAARLVYEGPVCAPEGGDQGGKQPGRPRPQPFPARDIRSKENRPSSAIENRSSSAIVLAMTRYCCQKPGGQFQPPGFSTSSSCIFCTLGCTCLGPNCMGHPKKPPEKSSSRLAPPPINIPGSVGDTSLTTLTELIKTSSMKNPIQAFQPQSDIFRWNRPNSSQVSSNSLSSKSTKSTRKPFKKQNVFSICSTSVYNPQVLKNFLKCCGTKDKTSSQSSKPSSKPSSEPHF